MTYRRRLGTLVLLTAAVAVFPLVSYTQNGPIGDLTHVHPATPDASVDFGVLPLAPIGPPPCFQSGAIGGPLDPCSYKLHHLTPKR
jgi:hypothetical protein